MKFYKCIQYVQISLIEYFELATLLTADYVT